MSKTNQHFETRSHHEASRRARRYQLNAVTGGMLYLVTFQKSSSPEVFRIIVIHRGTSCYLGLEGIVVQVPRLAV